VTVSAPGKFVQAGQKANFSVDARYFFGSPVANAEVKYYIHRSRYYAWGDEEGDSEDPTEESDNDDEYSQFYGDGYDEDMVKEGEGTLERQRSGALVVRPYSMETFLHALAVRRLLEGEAARLAAGKIAPAIIAEARARIARLRDEGLGDAARQDDRDFHVAIALASGNPVLATTIGDLRKRTAMFRLGRLPERVDQVCDEHLAIVEALAAGDGEAARTAMQVHIDNVRAHLLQRLTAI